VATPEAVIDLENWGADATKVGMGPGKVCITKLKTGFGTGGWQLSRAEVVRARGHQAHRGRRRHPPPRRHRQEHALRRVDGDDRLAVRRPRGEPRPDGGGRRPALQGVLRQRVDFNKGEYKHVEGKRILEPIKGRLADTLREMREDLQSSISYAGGRVLSDLKKVNYVILGGENAGEHLFMSYRARRRWG
jgi:GMP reductase